MIVDCPNERFISELASSPAFAAWQNGGKSAAVVVHLAPHEVRNTVTLPCLSYALGSLEVDSVLACARQLAQLFSEPRGRMQVVQQQAYQDWMQRFGSDTKHLVVNSVAAGRPPVFASACRLQV